MDLFEWQLALWFMVVYHQSKAGVDLSSRLPALLLTTPVKQDTELRDNCRPSGQNWYCPESGDLCVNERLTLKSSTDLHLREYVWTALGQLLCDFITKWSNPKISQPCSDKCNNSSVRCREDGAGTLRPPYLMTCKVYHVEQRHGHLTPGLIVTASKSLESSIGNQYPPPLFNC